MASTSTRPSSSAATSNPHSTDFAKDSSQRLSAARVLAAGAVIVVAGDEKNLRTAAFKANDVGFAQLTAIQADVVGADAGGQRLQIEEIGVPLVDLEPELAGLSVPVEIGRSRLNF